MEVRGVEEEEGSTMAAVARAIGRTSHRFLRSTWEEIGGKEGAALHRPAPAALPDFFGLGSGTQN